jgi:predicted Rossmann fold nucleotide-binding protein DprA/Smf involved in DNA uptake
VKLLPVLIALLLAGIQNSGNKCTPFDVYTVGHDVSSVSPTVCAMDSYSLTPDCDNYPAALTALLGVDAPASLACAGDANIMQHRTLALFCSVQCPGAMILHTYDMIQKLRHRCLTVIGGFHSPMERECLRTLGRGTTGVIWCLAKELERFRLPREFIDIFDARRLMVMSPFVDHAPRVTRETSAYRNRVAAAMADEIFLPYAAPGSHTEAFCITALSWDKPVYTLDAPENRGIIERGATPVSLSDIDSHWPEQELDATAMHDGLV